MWQVRLCAANQFAMQAPFETALVGAGRFGRVHAAKLARAQQSRLVAVIDPDIRRAEEVAHRWGASAYPSLSAALERHPRLRACVVVTPRAHLAEVAREALGASLDVLVEKPGAACGVEFAELRALAHARGRMLRVGYVERFLPAEPSPAPALLSVRAFAPGQTPEEILLDRLCHDVDRAVRVLGPVLKLIAARVRRGTLRVDLSAPDGRRARLVAWPAPSEARRWWTPGRRSRRWGAGDSDPLAAQWAAFEALVLGQAPTAMEPATAASCDAVWSLLEAARAELTRVRA